MPRNKTQPTKSEKLQTAWHRYETIRRHTPTGTMDAVRWAVHEGLLELPKIDPYEILAGQMASALRDEMATNAKGQRYRVNHAVRIMKGGVQTTIWAVMGYAPHEHMERAFTQRREQIVGDCVQLKIDVDTYNAKRPNSTAEIQFVLDFTDDVAERELAA